MHTRNQIAEVYRSSIFVSKRRKSIIEDIIRIITSAVALYKCRKGNYHGNVKVGINTAFVL